MRPWPRTCSRRICPPAGAAGPGGPVPARRGRGGPAPDPDPGVVPQRQVGPAPGPGTRQELQAVRLWAGGLARRHAGLRVGRRAPRRTAGRPAAPRGGALQGARADRHGDPGQPGHPHAQGFAAAARAARRAGRGPGAGLHPTYDPDANRIEWLWRSLRRTVTHTTSVSAWQTWWQTPTGGHARSLRRGCCRRSAARSHPTSSRLGGRNSTMQHELPGSIFSVGAGGGSAGKTAGRPGSSHPVAGTSRTPSCWKNRRLSALAQYSASLPSAMRRMSVPVKVRSRPAASGGAPGKPPA
jgi:hypothetical protein